MPKDNSTDSYTADEVLSPNFFCVDFYQKRKKGKYRLTLAPNTSYQVCDTHCHLEMVDNPEWLFIRCALHNVSYLACVIDSTDDGFDGINKVEVAYEKAKQLLPLIIEQIKNQGKQASEPVTIKAAEEKPELCLNLDAITEDPKLPDYCYIIGTHPHYAKHWNDKQAKNLEEMLKSKRAKCVGEIGLDFHYDLSPRDAQISVFKEQLQIADKHGFPVSLHLRESHKQALDIFEEIGFGIHDTLLHCFNLGPKDLKPWVDAGCYIALGGPVTFKNSQDTRDSIDLIPKDKLLTETDSPFMTPEPLRGDICFPDHIIYTVDLLCKITNNEDNKEEFYSQLFENAKRFLKF